MKKYAEFNGRARRQEYWMFFLVNFIIAVILVIVEGEQSNVLTNLYGLAVLLPGIAVGVRRLHDTDRSGLWLLIALVPIAGPIALLVFMAQDSQPGKNQYGPNPKANVTS